ncbi:hypothetical protein [Limnoglobus roseus]|uniref:Uncharacterized protein n=1 Tax=Limnoglobus roseus TaxID=2598579 RepID=A0A5C1A8T1_9BACT|nr:hypothetical protein [Limnoglobus roseus]QEL14687.1 hypothetical protein PX52LOC_01580 [Limnoglobus roseus]
MAKRKNPKGSNPPGDDDPKKSELPEWLRTDDWLQITPTPSGTGLPETPSGRIPVGLPPSKNDDLSTDIIQLDEDSVADVEVPPSTMLFSDPDDSVLLSDDILSPGPLSGKLKPSSSSSLRLPKIKPEVPPAPAASENADNDIDLGLMPDVDNPIAAGPASGVRRAAPAASDSDAAIGQPIKPTEPASGWLSNSGTKLETTPPAAKPPIPSTPNIAATWAELSVPQAKVLPELPKAAPETPTAGQHPGSWHPSSGDIGVPSLANIDLPPEIGDGGSDIFSTAKNPGLAPGSYPVEPVKIARPKAPDAPPVAEVKPPREATPATPSLQLPSLPNLPTEPLKGSWHPSSGNVQLPTQSDIDLPPEANAGGSDIFSKAKNPGLAPASSTPVLPSNLPKKPVRPEPQSLEVTNLPLPTTPVDPASGWLSGASKVGKTAKVDPPKAELPKVEPDSGLIPTSSEIDLPPIRQGLELPPPSSALHPTSSEIDLPPIPLTEPEPSDIFSTARAPGQPIPKGDSALFTGAQAPDSSIFPNLPQATAGESSLFTDLITPAEDTGRVSMAPPDAINVSPVLPGSKTDAVNFALPGPTDEDSSGVEVVDTSGTLDPGEGVATGPESGILSANPIIEDDSLPDPEFGEGLDLLDAELVEDEPDAGRPDFNIFPGVAGSDSNLLGDRTLVDAGLLGPHSSSVNLADPNALSRDPTADSGQLSSIFNKPDPAGSGGQIDLDSIPLMGSSDDGTTAEEANTSAVLGGRLDDPHAGDLEASVFDVTLPKDETADSGLIDWSTDAAGVTDRLGDASNRQPTLQRTLRTEAPDEGEIDTDGPITPTPPKPARKADVKRPVSRPEIDLDADAPKGRARNGLLISAISLLAGAGIGAGAMFLTGGSSGDKKSDPQAAVALADTQAKLTAAEQTAADAKKKADAAEVANKAINTELKTASAAVEAANKALNAEMKTATAATAAKGKLEGDLADLKKTSAEEIAAAKKKADDLEGTTKKLQDEKASLLTEVKKVTDDNTTLMAAVTAAKEDVAIKAKDLNAAKLAADAATMKLKAADATLDPVIDKLKAAKLIDEKADREKAIAALPEALKKANLITGEGDTAKLAKELTDARDELKKQKEAADTALKASTDKLTAAQATAEKQLADAKTAAEKSMADLQKKVDTADARIKDEVKTAVAAATKDADAKVAKAQEQATEQQKLAALEIQKAQAARSADAKAFEAKMAELTDQFQRQMATVKSGAIVPLNDVFVAKTAEAATAFDAGTTAYFAGRYADAEAAFARAGKADQTDARYWYFLGLSKYAQGKKKEAEADFKTGSDWEGRGKPGRRAVATALESIQGPARRALEAVRP